MERSRHFWSAVVIVGGRSGSFGFVESTLMFRRLAKDVSMFREDRRRGLGPWESESLHCSEFLRFQISSHLKTAGWGVGRSDRFFQK